jgi:serine/threonine protein phosphatase 1
MVTIERGEWQHAPKPLHTDHLICAIGDVHGRADLLDPLLAALADDARVPGVAHATCIFLGDLIDRGEQSFQTLGLAAGGLAAYLGDRMPVEDVLLLGNHDAWLKAAFEDRLTAELAELWAANGGQRTWRSLKVPPLTPLQGLGPALRAGVPQFVQDAVRGMRPSRRIGDYLFVHAGVDPRRPLDDQPEEVVTWIRDPFLHPEDHHWPFEVFVIHGHTPEEPFERPTVEKHRINLDTAAVFTGVLTAIEMRNDRYRFVQAKG